MHPDRALVILAGHCPATRGSIPAMSDACLRIDYESPAVWDRLAASLEHDFSPRPAKIFGHVNCEPEWSWTFGPSDYVLWLVTAGQGAGRLRDRPMTLGPGSLVVLRPGDRGEIYHDPTNRLTVTYVHFDFVAPGGSTPIRLEARWLPSSLIRLTDPHRLHGLLLQTVQLLREGGAYSRIEARLLLTQAILETYRQDAAGQGAGPKGIDPRILRVIHRVRTDPARRLSLPAAAELGGTSSRYFSRLFRQETGTSFRDFILAARMERAKVLLLESTLSVKAVATALGYVDPALFSRQYHEHVGEPPSQVRRTTEGATQYKPSRA